MKKLENTKEDKEFLDNLLSQGLTPKATFTLYGFTNNTADSLTGFCYNGNIIGKNSENYYDWVSDQGINMPCHHISSITLD